MAVGGVDIATLGLRLDGRQMQRESVRTSAALNKMGQAGTGVTNIMAKLGVTLAAGFALQKVTRGAGEFEGAMARSLAIMGDVTDHLRGEMAVEARKVGIELNLGATKAAEAYFYLASAGFDAAQSISAMGAVATFAKAGMFNMATATDLATDAQSALGLASKDTQANLEGLTRVTDVLVKANTLANASVEQFATSLTTEAGAALKTMGKDIEEGVAVLAAFADQGVKAQVAGSGLSRILRLMSSAAVNNAGAYAELGVEVFDAGGNMKNLADIIEDLEQAFGPMSDATRTAALETLGFQARVQGVILPLIGTSQKIREYEAALRQAGGTTQQVADKQMLAPFERLGAAWQVFKDHSIDAGNALLKVFIPALELAAEHSRILLDILIALGVAMAALAALKLTAVVSSLALAFGAWYAAVVSFIPAVTSLSAALAFLEIIIGPVGWIVLGITAIVSVLTLWRRAQQEAKEEAERLTTALEEKKTALSSVNDEQLLATKLQLEHNIALRTAAWQQGTTQEQVEILAREKELLAEVNRLMKERQTLEGIEGGGLAPGDDNLSDWQQLLEIFRELNEEAKELGRQQLKDLIQFGPGLAPGPGGSQPGAVGAYQFQPTPLTARTSPAAIEAASLLTVMLNAVEDLAPAVESTARGISSMASGLGLLSDGAREALRGVVSIADGFQTFRSASKLTGLTKTLGQVGGMIGMVGGAIGVLSSLFSINRDEARRLATAQSEFNQSIQDLMGDVLAAGGTDLSRATERMRQQFNDLITGFTDVYDIWEHVAGKIQIALGTDMEGMLDFFSEVLGYMEEGTPKYAAWLKLQEYAIKLIEQQTEAIAEQNRLRGRAFEADLAAREAELGGDAQAAMTARLVEQQQKEIDAAQKLLEAGAITEEQFLRLRDVLDQELARAIMDVADAAEQAASRMQDAFRNVVETLNAFRAGLLVGPQSMLSPTRQLEEARRQYQATVTAARGGDVEAAGRLPELARSLLEASRAVHASGAGYVKEFQYVQDTLASVSAHYEDQITVEEEIRDAAQGTTSAVQESTKAIVGKLEESIEHQERSVQMLSAGFMETIERLAGVEQAVGVNTREVKRAGQGVPR